MAPSLNMVVSLCIVINFLYSTKLCISNDCCYACLILEQKSWNVFYPIISEHAHISSGIAINLFRFVFNFTIVTQHNERHAANTLGSKDNFFYDIRNHVDVDVACCSYIFRLALKTVLLCCCMYPLLTEAIMFFRFSYEYICDIKLVFYRTSSG